MTEPIPRAGRYYVLRPAPPHETGFLLTDITMGRSPIGGAMEMTLTLRSDGEPKLADDPIVTARERALINLGKAGETGNAIDAELWRKLASDLAGPP